MYRFEKKQHNAFTLIELLIVVAIIAILAAIAVPNFLEAQVRAKVARCHADMRTMATAAEAYAVDWNRCPIGQDEVKNVAQNQWDYPARWGYTSPLRNFPPYTIGRRFAQWTTPIAYVTSIPKDPFIDQGDALKVIQILNLNPAEFELDWVRAYGFSWLNFTQTNDVTPHQIALGNGHLWYLSSPGPIKITWAPDYLSIPNTLNFARGGTYNPNGIYDPTNGTVSKGRILRTSAGILGK